MRYINTPNIKDDSGKRKKATWIWVAPPKGSNDTYIRITSPDRLDILAGQFYGNQREWPIIAAANGLGKGTLSVPANTVLRIPPDTKIIEIVTNVNESR